MKTTRDKGSALLLVLIALLILSLIGLSALTQSGSEINTTGNFFKDKSAFYAADAGIQVGMKEIQDQFTNPILHRHHGQLDGAIRQSIPGFQCAAAGWPVDRNGQRTEHENRALAADRIFGQQSRHKKSGPQAAADRGDHHGPRILKGEES
jgi:hypothetical protein